MKKRLRHIVVCLLLMLLVICGVSAASAKGFKVQLMEEGTEYTQFIGGWPWDIQPFTIPFQQADDRVICGAWVPKATPISQDCVLAAVERGDKILLVGGLMNWSPDCGYISFGHFAKTDPATNGPVLVFNLDTHSMFINAKTKGAKQRERKRILPTDHTERLGLGIRSAELLQG